LTIPAFTREITYEQLTDISKYFTNKGKPLFTAYGCALLECPIDKSWVYKAVNLKTGATKLLSRRKKQIDEAAYPSMSKKISMSSLRGTGRWEVDRSFGDYIPGWRLQELLQFIFQDILPAYRYIQREKQIELANDILKAITTRKILLAEAEVGIGKTHAYLIAAILAKRGRVNDLANVGCYRDRMYAKAAHMPIVISTSSIALQQAIVKDYVPTLSQMLMECDIIRTPLSIVVRKGKAHYVCQRRLLLHLPYEHDRYQREILESLTSSSAPIDFADIVGLTRHVKDKIHVPNQCTHNCPQKELCGYQRYLVRAKSPEVDIQVCNHNYLLADTRHRILGWRPLIPDYQCLIIDEAHAFLPAARQMYGAELSKLTIPKIVETIHNTK